MLELYDFALSGNCHKIRLILSMLELEYKLVPLKLQEDAHKFPPSLQISLLSQVPVLSDDTVTIRDPQAILVYLAQRYGGETWLPTSSEKKSKVMQWLFIAANEIHKGFAAPRLHYLFNIKVNVEYAHKRAYRILETLNLHLQKRQWLECEHPTIADIACFPYIGLASDAKIVLDPYINVISWIDRVKCLPGYVEMPGLQKSEVSPLLRTAKSDFYSRSQIQVIGGQIDGCNDGKALLYSMREELQPDYQGK